MAYDLRAGRNPEASQDVGAIRYTDYPILVRLAEKRDSFFFRRISDLYTDQAFSSDEVAEALDHIFPLLTGELDQQERALLTKLISALSYTDRQTASLFCVAD